MEEEKRKILDQFKEDLAKGKTEALHNVRLTRAEIEEAVLDILPKEHEKSHEDMRKFIEHSPEPKIHGDHHDFTESVRGRLEHSNIHTHIAGPQPKAPCNPPLLPRTSRHQD